MDSTSARRYYSYNSVIQKRKQKIRESVLRMKRVIRQRKFREEQSRQRVMLSLLLCCCAVITVHAHKSCMGPRQK